MAANQRITHFPESAQSMYESAGARMEEVCHETEEMIRHNPTTSLLVTFGVGFGLGLALTTMLMPSPRHRTWAERNLPDWLSREQFMAALSHVPEKVSAVRSSWW